MGNLVCWCTVASEDKTVGKCKPACVRKSASRAHKMARESKPADAHRQMNKGNLPSECELAYEGKSAGGYWQAGECTSVCVCYLTCVSKAVGKCRMVYACKLACESMPTC
eukprot:1102114-Pleurochrysis_carterae.AAC.1